MEKNYFQKRTLTNNILGMLLIILGVIVAIFYMLMHFKYSEYVSILAFTISIPVIIGGYITLIVKEKYIDSEGIWTDNEKIKWKDIRSVYFLKNNYTLLLTSGRKIEIQGKFYILEEAFDKHLDFINDSPDNSFLRTRRWSKRGQDYADVSFKDSAYKKFTPYIWKTVPNDLILLGLLLVVSFLIFGVFIIF